MKVIKRDGSEVDMNYHQITERIAGLAHMDPPLDKVHVDPTQVSQKTIAGLYDLVKTSQIDDLAAETAASMIIQHPDYGWLASRIVISNIHKNTPITFLECTQRLRAHIDPKTKQPAPLIDQSIVDLAIEFEQQINETITPSKDYRYTYFGIKTLMKSYLMSSNGGDVNQPIELTETPQYMMMRVALGIWGTNWKMVKEVFVSMSNGEYTHATPTLFNAGTLRPQMSSCFLLKNKEDSIEGLFDTIKQCAQISKWSGGIGLAISDIRASGSYIKGTGGYSQGLIPMARTYNDVCRWVDQGGGKRKGSFAMYVEPWHADIFDFLDLKKNTGKEEMRARDLFYALWIPDLFMKRVEQNGDWTLMCPAECPGLPETHSEEFEALYTKYEAEGKGRKTIKAQDLWMKILESQVETGTPYMLYKDAANSKSNQKNLGTIKSSNLCTEIIEYTSPDEIAVCNLASIAVNCCVDPVTQTFDHEKLGRITYTAAISLNRVIDVTYYPVEEARNSNMRHRPIGLGIQGLADAYAMMRFPFDSPEAAQLNEDIFETIYYYALKASNDLAKEDGIYSSFKGSPASKGILQFDMWDRTNYVHGKGRYDWGEIKVLIRKYGIRNSLLVAPMPTASTAQILGNNECFEPFTSNIYTRRVLSGEFIFVNTHLVNDLIKEGLWNKKMYETLKQHNGSVQNIPQVPTHLKELYKTAWEISQRNIIDQAAARGMFIDQSQSMNIFMEDANFGKLTSMHFYGWKKGLKTGMYYLRTKAATDAIKFTVDQDAIDEQPAACSLDNPDCETCSA
jgi:ribonucleoside-diphosphate reductase alpha subunit